MGTELGVFQGVVVGESVGASLGFANWTFDTLSPGVMDGVSLGEIKGMLRGEPDGGTVG